jgi:8-oxo-dGTP pyrophosphatase MutT (NUDIX family)
MSGPIRSGGRVYRAGAPWHTAIMSERVIASTTVAWAPEPHRFELVLSSKLPPTAQTTSAFVFLVDAAERTLLAEVGGERGRGWDVPGGHVDPGEDPQAAAIRELAEETGWLLDPAELTPLGSQRITLLAPAPAGYRYPDVSHLVVFTARLAGLGPPTTPPAESECTAAAWLTRAQIEQACGRRPWLPLHRAVFDPLDEAAIAR